MHVISAQLWWAQSCMGQTSWGIQGQISAEYYASMNRSQQDATEGHIRDMKEIYNRLAMLDDRVNEEDQVINLLASLPPNYNAVLWVLLAQVPETTWTDV